MLKVHPEVQRLRDECELLASQHAELVAEIDMLRHNVIPYLTARYMVVVGVLELELLELRCEVQRRRRLLEMINASVNQGERPCLELLERQLDCELEAWRERIGRMHRELEDARVRRRASEGPVSDEDARALKCLYRAMVRKLHPDLHPDLGDRGRALWLRLQDAYTRCDLDAMRTLVLLVDDFGEDAGEGWTHNGIDVMRAQRERLSSAVMALVEEIAVLRAGFPYDHRERLDDPAWVAEKTRGLRAEIEEQGKRRERLGELLTAVVGEAWRCEPTDTHGGPSRHTP